MDEYQVTVTGPAWGHCVRCSQPGSEETKFWAVLVQDAKTGKKLNHDARLCRECVLEAVRFWTA